MINNFINYYSKKDIQNKIVNSCEGRELAAKLGERGFRVVIHRDNLVLLD